MYRRPQRIHKKASRAVNEFNKVVGYKINTKKSIVFLYTSQINIFPKRKLASNSIFNSIYSIKYLGINLTKEVNNVYAESYKTLKKANI